MELPDNSAEIVWQRTTGGFCSIYFGPWVAVWKMAVQVTCWDLTKSGYGHAHYQEANIVPGKGARPSLSSCHICNILLLNYNSWVSMSSLWLIIDDNYCNNCQSIKHPWPLKGPKDNPDKRHSWQDEAKRIEDAGGEATKLSMTMVDTWVHHMGLSINEPTYVYRGYNMIGL